MFLLCRESIFVWCWQLFQWTLILCTQKDQKCFDFQYERRTLKDLSILLIENNVLDELYTDKVINKFATLKSCKVYIWFLNFTRIAFVLFWLTNALLFRFIFHIHTVHLVALFRFCAYIQTYIHQKCYSLL